MNEEFVNSENYFMRLDSNYEQSLNYYNNINMIYFMSTSLLFLQKSKNIKMYSQ